MENDDENTKAGRDCQERLVRHLDFEGRKQRYEEVAGSLDRYGTPHDGIINMLEALSDFIDDEAHGRGGYDVYFKIMQDELDSLRSGYLPNNPDQRP